MTSAELIKVEVRVSKGRKILLHPTSDVDKITCSITLSRACKSSFVYYLATNNSHSNPEWDNATLQLLATFLNNKTSFDVKALVTEPSYGMWRPLNDRDHKESGEIYITFTQLLSDFMLKHVKNRVEENQQQRVVRVFLSSTFLDMHEEREVIMRRVMVTLNAFCYERSVALTYIDMRWGITEEMTKNGQTILSCLREVDHSRPYFVGLIGERYGWHQEVDGSDIPLTQTFEIAEMNQETKSVTELEIFHGFLKHPYLPGHSFFYFRDPDYITTIDPNLRKRFVDYSPYATTQLNSLKEKIKTAPGCIFSNYKTPDQIEELLLSDLKKVIEEDFPLEKSKNFVNLEHENYAHHHCSTYVNRSILVQQFQGIIESDGNTPIVLTGESGSGKSSFLADCWKNINFNKKPSFIHFCGLSTHTSELSSILLRVIKFIQEILKNTEIVPSDEMALAKLFSELLEKVSSEGGVVIILDAINQLNNEGDYNLWWIPKHIPPNVSFVISTLDCTAVTEAKSRGWSFLSVPPLQTDEKTQIVDAKLNLYGKTISRINLHKIVAHPLSSSPIFLVTVLSEMCTIGFYKEFENQLSSFLNCQHLVDVFLKVIERWEKDFGKPNVQKVLSILYSSRNGLSESNLMKASDMAPQDWSPLMSAIRLMLSINNGLFNFFHSYIKQAVENRYQLNGIDSQNQEEARVTIISHYEKESQHLITYDITRELPWQYFKLIESYANNAQHSITTANLPEKLLNFICDPKCLSFFLEEKLKYDLFQYLFNNSIP